MPFVDFLKEKAAQASKASAKAAQKTKLRADMVMLDRDMKARKEKVREKYAFSTLRLKFKIQLPFPDHILHVCFPFFALNTIVRCHDV